MRPDKELKVNAADEPKPEGNLLPVPAPQAPAPEPAAPKAPTLKTANFVNPAWRGRKYITPEVFRRRVYAYFGHRLSKSGLHRWLTGGRIAAIRIGNRWLIPESTWDEFLECCRHGERI